MIYTDKGLYVVKAVDLTVDEGAQEIIAVISNGAVDRDKEVVLPNGLNKRQYQGLKVYKNHDYTKDPSGSIKWLKKDEDKVIMKWKVFTISDEQKLMWEFLKGGVYDQYSIGFMFNPETASPPTPQELKKHPEWQSARRIIREWEPFEVSVVGIPANNETLTLAISKGMSELAIKTIKAQIKDTQDTIVEEVKALDINAVKKDIYESILKELKR